MPLSPEKIQQLLARKNGTAPAREPDVRQGPLRPLDNYPRTKRCVNRGCLTPAYWTVKGMPYCNAHTAYALNSIVVEMSGEEVVWEKPQPVLVEDLLDIIYELLHDGTTDRAKDIMEKTYYPNLRRQLDVFEELRRQRVGDN